MIGGRVVHDGETETTGLKTSDALALTGLPMVTELPRIVSCLREQRNLVLFASPGAGKTTLVPLALLDEPWLQGKSIIMLQPRRIAARLAAARMAVLHGSEVGGTVGYQVRFERRIGRDTRIEVLTEGLLTRRLQTDPFLERVGIIIFDEFHERHLHTDLGLALVREIQQTVREDLRILVMSATLDAAAISEYLDRCPNVDVPGFLHPVAEEYAGWAVDQPLPRQVAKAVRRELQTGGSGDLLVFLPGEGEIYRTLRELEDAGLPANVVCLPLHGSLPLDRQDEILKPNRSRRIILATNIAETSLTIEGITTVIDSGFRRRNRLDPKSGLERLELERISRDSAIQRAGRAGRLGPGKVVRLWSRQEHAALVPFVPPEIQSTDLAEAILQLAFWGKNDPAALQWFQPPPPELMSAAQTLLRGLGAIGDDGKITAAGQRLARLPVHPRLARILLEGLRCGGVSRLASACALLSEKPLRGAGGRGGSSGSDLFASLDALEELRFHGFRRSGGEDVDVRAAQRIDRVAEQLQQVMRHELKAAGPERRLTDDEFLRCLLAGFPDRVARRRSCGTPVEGAGYLLAGGKGLTLDPRSSVREAEFIIALSVDGVEREQTQVGVIRQAAHIKPEWLKELFPASVRLSRELKWDQDRQAVVVQQIERYLDLPLAEQIVAPGPQDADGIARLLAREAARDVQVAFAPDPEVEQLLLRLELFARETGKTPDADGALSGGFEALVPDLVAGCRSFADLRRLNLRAAIEQKLSYRVQQELQKMVPERLEVPSGSHVKIQYRRQDSPVLAVKLQELFGLLETPRVCRGRVPVLIHLLSPAGRPLQVTQDLRSFWLNTYPALRREMRGQYPRHPWPEDPLTAVPTRKTAPRKK
jgi:ATP-dependent helicase HrpB